MRRVTVPLLMLVVASAFVGIPARADTSEASWQITLLASNADTLVSPDARYCLMPASMPIRPWNEAALRDAEGLLVETARLEDAVMVTPDAERFATDAPCHLVAKFSPVAPQEGLRVVITPQPQPADRSTSLRVNIDLGIQVVGPFDWSYDEFGYKRCHSLGAVQLGQDSLVITSPDSRLRGGPNPQATRFTSLISYSEESEEESCLLIASLEFPIADEYVIEFGGDGQAADGN